MANPKRASMREGPLAALFRQTDPSEGDLSAPPEADPSPEEQTDRGRGRSAGEDGVVVREIEVRAGGERAVSDCEGVGADRIAVSGRRRHPL